MLSNCKDGFCLVTLKMQCTDSCGNMLYRQILYLLALREIGLYHREVERGTKKRLHCLHIAVELIV